MSTFRKNNSKDKCCDEVNMQAPPKEGEDPPIFGPKEQWTICYSAVGGVANYDGPSLSEQIANLFKNLGEECKQSLATELEKNLGNQTNQIISNFINNPNARCKNGECREIDIGLLETPDSNGDGITKICCKDGELDNSNGSSANSGWVVGAVNIGQCN